jgi:hypothetical protein
MAKWGDFMKWNARQAMAKLGDFMNLTTRKLHIFYRHVHMTQNATSRDRGKKQRPEWFSHEKCFCNLLETLEHSPLSSNVSLTVIYDGNEADFHTDFIYRRCATQTKFKTTVIVDKAGSNMKSWLVALDQVKKTPMANSDIIYFLENDYLHLDGWLEKVAELYASPIKFDYVSLYDHKDKYFSDMYSELTSKIFVTPTHHWRTTPSTCGTFMLSRKVFLEDVELWAREVGDHHQFTELCQTRGRVLLTPIHGLSTHCMEKYLSPTINWSKV